MRASNAPQRRFPWWAYALAFFVIAGIALWPAVVSSIGESLAAAHGCRIDEMHLQPCLIDGRDQGVMIYNLAMSIWYMFLTLPAGLILLLIWLGVLISHRMAWVKKRVAP